jgi:hypothetical protein
VQGTTDILVYANNTEVDFNRTCSAFPDSKATLILYPGTDHDVAGENAIYDYLRWIQQRFDGVEVTKGCHIQTAEPITTTFRDKGTVYGGISAS